MEFGELVYYEVRSRRRSTPANLFVQEPSTGPTRALVFDHPTKTWKFHPIAVQYLLVEDIDQGEDRISKVDRIRAEEIALLLGTPLPSDTQLRHLIEDGANKPTV